MKLHFLIPVLALACGSAAAQNSPSGYLEKVPAQDNKMVQISDGLYAKTSANSESYVAVNPNGQKALLQKLIQIRNRVSVSSINPKTDNNKSTVIVDELISTLNRPKSMAVTNGVTYGDCNGSNTTGPFYANSTAGGGVGGSTVGASGTAQNQDTSATPVYTTNYVHVLVTDPNGDTVGEQATTQFGTTAAVASAYSVRGCTESASATLTCPGHSGPSVTSFTYAHKKVGGSTCVPN